jgi:hypothetical protein
MFELNQKHPIMKLISKLCLTALILMFSFSCSGDDDSAPPIENENFLKVGNQEFELKSGSYGTDSLEEGLYAFGIIIYNTNVSVVDGEPIPEDDIVNGISFEIYTGNSTKPDLGEYIFTGASNPGEDSLAAALILSNINVENQTGETIEIEVGILEIVENENEYVLNFTGIDKEDNEISMNFRGSLTLVEN